MRNTLAEWLLSLVAPEDHAGTILGDLLEDYADSPLFWFSLLRTVFSIGMHRPQRVLSSTFWLAIDIGLVAFWIWFYTHILGLSYLLAGIFVIPVELLQWYQRRRSRASRARRSS